MRIALIGDNTNRRRELLSDDLKDRLEELSAVSKVIQSSYGQEEIHILVDQDQLEKNNLTSIASHRFCPNILLKCQPVL